MLAEPFWEKAAARLGSDIVAIFPHQEIVYCTSSKSAKGIAALQAELDKVDFDDDGSLSPDLFIYRNGVWDVFQRTASSESRGDTKF